MMGGGYDRGNRPVGVGNDQEPAAWSGPASIVGVPPNAWAGPTPVAPGLIDARVADVTVTTEAIIAGGVGTQALFPANYLVPGMTFRVLIEGRCTASGTPVATFRLRWGTAGTTADGVLASFAVTGISGTSSFRAEIVFTVRTVGTAGTIAGFVSMNQTGSTGIAQFETTAGELTVSSFNTLAAANYLTVTLTAGSTSVSVKTVAIARA